MGIGAHEGESSHVGESKVSGTNGTSPNRAKTYGDRAGGASVRAARTVGVGTGSVCKESAAAARFGN
jgi:hypothetical protein